MFLKKWIVFFVGLTVVFYTHYIFAQEDFSDIDDQIELLEGIDENDEKVAQVEPEKDTELEDNDDHEGHAHGPGGHGKGSNDKNFDVFYSTYASLDLNQFLGNSLRRTFDVKNLEAGIGFIIGEQLETFFMVYKEEGPGFNIGLHEAEITYFPNEKIEITGGLFHMPFGWGSKKLLFEPLINDCKLAVHEEIIDTIEGSDTLFKDIEEEVVFHSIATHAPGISGSYNFGKLKLGGSYYIQPDENLGENAGHSHGGFGAHQGITFRADYKFNKIVKTGIGTRIRIADIEHHEDEEELGKTRITQEEEEETGTKGDLDFDIGVKVKPLQKLTLLAELYFSPSANIAPDQGTFVGYFLEADYSLRENWLVSTRLDQFINSNRIDEHHEEEMISGRQEEEPEKEHDSFSIVQFGLGSTYNISEYFAIKGEFNVRNPVEVFHDDSQDSEIIIGLQMSFNFSN